VPRIVRTADVTWSGNVARGEGKLSGGSGALELLPFTLATRIGDPAGKTSPEELIAAAVGSCYAMSLASELSKAGSPPELLSVSATTIMDEVGADHRVVAVELDVTGRVPGMELDDFRMYAEAAEAGCSMAHLVRGTAEVRLSALLEA
jgi:osmotically inducible protein OsmC